MIPVGWPPAIPALGLTALLSVTVGCTLPTPARIATHPRGEGPPCQIYHITPINGVQRLVTDDACLRATYGPPRPQRGRGPTPLLLIPGSVEAIPPATLFGGTRASTTATPLDQ